MGAVCRLDILCGISVLLYYPEAGQKSRAADYRTDRWCINANDLSAKKYNMKNRNFVSLSISFSFVAIAVTGIFLYLGIKSEAIEIVHVLFGLIFTGLAVFHIRYNFASIKNYSANRKTNGIRKELVASGLVNSLLLLLMCLGFSFMDELTHAGRDLVGNGKRQERRGEGVVFSQLSTNQHIQGTSLQLIIWEQEEVLAPVIAIWVEETDGKLTEGLLVPAQRLTIPATVRRAQDLENPGIRSQVQYSVLQHDILPEFNRRRREIRPNYDRATPLNSFILQTNTSARQRFMLYLEMNYLNRTELYSATIDPAANTVFLLQPGKGNQWIRKGVISIRS